MERDFEIIQYKFTPTWIVVNRDNNSILCQGIRKYPYIIYQPIEWKDYNDCDKWCKVGYISEIQESFGNLDIRFTDKLLHFIKLGVEI